MTEIRECVLKTFYNDINLFNEKLRKINMKTTLTTERTKIIVLGKEKKMGVIRIDGHETGLERNGKKIYNCRQQQIN